MSTVQSVEVSRHVHLGLRETPSGREPPVEESAQPEVVLRGKQGKRD